MQQQFTDYGVYFLIAWFFLTIGIALAYKVRHQKQGWGAWIKSWFQ